jgi:stage II sporulation protein GA (sporulation sigma-E factor processing peptidase)
MDAVLLIATAWTRKLRFRMWRIILAAAFGSLYVLALFIPDLTGLFSFAAKMLVSMLMVLIAFGFGQIRVFLRNLAAFYLITFAVAGGIFGLYYYFMPSKELVEETRSGLYRWSIGYGLIFGALVLMVWLFLRVFHGAKQKEAVAAHLAQVMIHVGEFELRCTGLVDTGNQLYDPLTKTPVMIVEAVLWKEVLPESWLKRIQTSDADQIVAAMGGDDFIWQDRLRIVPYRGVNRGTQFMLAIKPDSVRVQTTEREWETGRVLIGFDGGTLSSDGSYRAIIHPMLLQE